MYNISDTCLFKERLIDTVAVDDGGLRKKVAQFFTTLRVFLDELNIDTRLDKLVSEIVCGLAAADDYRAPYGVCLKSDGLKE